MTELKCPNCGADCSGGDHSSAACIARLVARATAAEAALEAVSASVPAIDEQGFFVVHFDGDGNEIGTQAIDPVSVVQSMQSIAQAALQETEATRQPVLAAPPNLRAWSQAEADRLVQYVRYGCEVGPAAHKEFCAVKEVADALVAAHAHAAAQDTRRLDWVQANGTSLVYDKGPRFDDGPLWFAGEPFFVPSTGCYDRHFDRDVRRAIDAAWAAAAPVTTGGAK